ncbi:MAG TPA: DUF4836 family protein [Chitinophagaceae bacterium]|nr:DUF4836 family protein [Chitinophagaceae bacterium]
MKQRHLLGLCSVLVLSIVLHSCGSAAKDAVPVPKDAAFVLHLNTKSLNSKLSWEEIKQTSWFKDAQSTNMNRELSATDSLARQLMQDPESSGIDTKDEIVFFVKRINTKEGFFVVGGRVKDAAKFEAFNKKMSDNQAGTAAKEGDITSMSLNKKVLASWSGNKFLYVIDGNTSAFNPSRGMEDLQFDSSGNVIPPADDEIADEDVKPADLKGYTTRLYNLKSDSLLGNDSRYSDLLKTDADMHFWMNSEQIYGSTMPFGVMSMLKLEKYIKGSVTAASLNFDNGKIVMQAKSYSNEEMSNLAKKYSGDNINANFLERIPSDSVAALVILNYKPEGLKEFLKIGGLDGMVNSFMAEIGITLDDFVAANGGDVMFALTDIQMKPYTINLGEGMEPYTTTKPEMQVLFATSVGNKASFDKLVNIGKKYSQQMRIDTMVFYSLTDKLFAAGSEQSIVDQFVKGGNRNQPFASKLKDHPMAAYVDLQRFMRAFGSMARDSSAVEQLNASLNFWQDITMTGGDFKDGGVEQQWEVNLVDKNTNSLKQLNQYADKMAQASKQRGF